MLIPDAYPRLQGAAIVNLKRSLTLAPGRYIPGIFDNKNVLTLGRTVLVLIYFMGQRFDPLGLEHSQIGFPPGTRGYSPSLPIPE